MNTQLIKLFNVALVENEKMSMSQFKEINQLAARAGYFVHPDVCNNSVLSFLKEQVINPNATFYKSWVDVISKTRLELLFDQLFHYLTTYGTNFALGNGYVPNDGDNDAPLLDYSLFKTIMPISRKDLYDKCFNMLTSGIALKKETMQACADFVIEEVHNGVLINVDEITNREALIYICTKLNIWPNNPMNLFRMIMFLTTDDTMIINNTTTISKIVRSSHPFNFNKLSQNNLVELSSIFLRFKNLFLAFKHNNVVNNKSIINKLRKMAVNNHKPFVPGFWQTLFSEQKNENDIKSRLGELTTFKKIALMQTCLERIGNDDNKIYMIRNGKVFFKEGCQVPENNVSYYVKVYNILRNSVIETLKTNSQKEVMITDIETGNEVTTMVVKKPKLVKVYNGMSVALPTSEKSYIGNYPFGTSYQLTDNNFVACYWRNEWGTRDYDLSLIDERGHKIGWNSDYYTSSQNVIYSGDMTNADPEACEVIKIINPDDFMATVKINQFSGNEKSKFELLFGQTHKKYSAYNNYMVDPNEIKFRATIEHENKNELQVALIADNKVTLMEVHSGNSIISRAFKKAKDYMRALANKTHYFVNAEELLREAGYEIVNETYTGDVDIDFANLEKDSLIKLMA